MREYLLQLETVDLPERGQEIDVARVDEQAPAGAPPDRAGMRADLQSTRASRAEPQPGQRFPSDSTVSPTGSSAAHTLSMQEHSEQEYTNRSFSPPSPISWR